MPSLVLGYLFGGCMPKVLLKPANEVAGVRVYDSKDMPNTILLKASYIKQLYLMHSLGIKPVLELPDSAAEWKLTRNSSISIRATNGRSPIPVSITCEKLTSGYALYLNVPDPGEYI